jgi:hypothetical protein
MDDESFQKSVMKRNKLLLEYVVVRTDRLTFKKQRKEDNPSEDETNKLDSPK